MAKKMKGTSPMYKMSPGSKNINTGSSFRHTDRMKRFDKEMQSDAKSQGMERNSPLKVDPVTIIAGASLLYGIGKEVFGGKKKKAAAAERAKKSAARQAQLGSREEETKF